MKEKLKGGKGDGKKDSEFDSHWLSVGIKVEREHTDDPEKAKEIAKDHLTEDPQYYKKLRRIEKSMHDEMMKSVEVTGERGGKYHLSETGKRVYSHGGSPRPHAQTVQNIKTGTSHAMRALRSGKIGEYERARKFLSQYDKHPDASVRKVLAAAHDVLHRSAHEMIARSKTPKAHHIYSLISSHHKFKFSQEPEAVPEPKRTTEKKSGNFYKIKSELHAKKMNELSAEYDRLNKDRNIGGARNKGMRDSVTDKYSHNKRAWRSAMNKRPVEPASMSVSMTKSKKAKSKT